jgi:hypothetical protein
MIRWMLHIENLSLFSGLSAFFGLSVVFGCVTCTGRYASHGAIILLPRLGKREHEERSILVG